MAQSHPKAKSLQRSIGNPRASTDYTNGRLLLPPVQANKTDYIAEGMIVSSMAVPPQKAAAGSAKKPSLATEAKPKSGDSPESTNRKSTEEWERLLREKDRTIREKEREVKDKSALVQQKDQQVTRLTVSDPQSGDVPFMYQWCRATPQLIVGCTTPTTFKWIMMALKVV